MASSYPRNMIGYGARPPHPHWPDDARIAVQIVVNYEEGGENSILHGDAAAEAFLSEIPGVDAWVGQRHPNMESIYEYGSRAGFWRLYRMLTAYQVPITVFGVTMALERNPEIVAAMRAADWEIACHAARWIDFRHRPEEAERDHILDALERHRRITGSLPEGWYTGRSSENTLRLVDAAFDPLYLADSYADDLPYWLTGCRGGRLIIPYALDSNDMRFATVQGFNSGEQFFTYLRDSFDILYEEGIDAPKMLSIGLHCRLIGRPGRIAGLRRFLDHVRGHDRVWLCRRADLARHWQRQHPYAAATAMGVIGS